MKLCYAVLHYDPLEIDSDPEAYLDSVPIHSELPRRLAALGHRVEVVHAAPYDCRLTENGVAYHFVGSGALLARASAAMGNLLHRDRVLYELAVPAVERIRSLKPDLIHFHGVTLNWNLHLLLRRLGKDTPVLLHYHGGFPAANPLTRAVQRYNFSHAVRVLFTTRLQAKAYTQAGILEDRGRVVELIETSTTFSMRPRGEARRQTGVYGDPVFLWTARLHPIKDPLTALRGFAKIVCFRPEAQLYLYYKSEELLPALRDFVRQVPGLHAHVHFRGRAPAGKMEAVYNSADFFLQASRREFSGCALLEAMACGAIPVVTDIPSFRAITEAGCYGFLFRRGDPEELARRALQLQQREIAPFAHQVARKFQRDLSFDAMARKLEEIYQAVGRENMASGTR